MQQAVTLAERLSSEPVRRLFASPTQRCVQTLEPLGELLQLPIEWLDRLAPSAPPHLLVETLTDRDFDGAVLCTHGELMRPLLRALRRDALTIESARPRVSHLEHLEPLPALIP